MGNDSIINSCERRLCNMQTFSNISLIICWLNESFYFCSPTETNIVKMGFQTVCSAALYFVVCQAWLLVSVYINLYRDSISDNDTLVYSPISAEDNSNAPDSTKKDDPSHNEMTSSSSKNSATMIIIGTVIMSLLASLI